MKVAYVLYTCTEMYLSKRYLAADFGGEVEVIRRKLSTIKTTDMMEVEVALDGAPNHLISPSFLNWVR